MEFQAKGIPIDEKIILNHLLDKGLLDRAGGPTSVVDLLAYDLDPSRFRHNVQTLTEKLARRMTIKAAESMREAAFTADSADELLDATGAPITAIHDTILAIKPPQSLRVVINSVLLEAESLMKGETSPMGMKTNIPVIDRKFLGMHRNRTVVISGYPSGGKSLLAGQFCAEAFKEGHNSLFVSLEMSKADLVKRLICYLGGIAGKALRDPKEFAWKQSDGKRESLSMEELKRIQNGATILNDAPFEIEHLTGANEQAIAAVIRKHHRKSPLAMVVVDFAQRIRPSSETRGQSREQQLSHASKVLADLAQELGFCLLLLSQLSKDGATKHAEALNEDCDLHLQILQDKDSKEHMGIAVPKDRHNGQVGALLPVKLNEWMIRFEEQTQKAP